MKFWIGLKNKQGRQGFTLIALLKAIFLPKQCDWLLETKWFSDFMLCHSCECRNPHNYWRLGDVYSQEWQWFNQITILSFVYYSFWNTPLSEWTCRYGKFCHLYAHHTWFSSYIISLTPILLYIYADWIDWCQFLWQLQLCCRYFFAMPAQHRCVWNH